MSHARDSVHINVSLVDSLKVRKQSKSRSSSRNKHGPSHSAMPNNVLRQNLKSYTSVEEVKQGNVALSNQSYSSPNMPIQRSNTPRSPRQSNRSKEGTLYRVSQFVFVTCLITAGLQHRYD